MHKWLKTIGIITMGLAVALVLTACGKTSSNKAHSPWDWKGRLHPIHTGKMVN